MNSALQITPEANVTSNKFVIKTHPAFIINSHKLLIADSVNYEKEISRNFCKHLWLFGNEIVCILIHTDSVNKIERVAYILKVSGSSVIDSISKTFGSIQLSGSFSKKLLSNFDIVEQVYFWDYDKDTNLMLVFFDKRQANETIAQTDSDLAVITVYRKQKRKPGIPNAQRY